MAKVLIPTPLRQFTGKQDAVTASGGTVGEVLAALTLQFPDLRKQIFNDEGKLRSFVNVYLNDEDIRYLKKDATAAKDGDTISLVPSIAGGSTVAAPPETAELSKDEILRYSRHLIIPEVGIEGQQKLKAAKQVRIFGYIKSWTDGAQSSSTNVSSKMKGIMSTHAHFIAYCVFPDVCL